MFVRPSQGRITSPFGMRTHPVTGRPSTMHWGVDFGRDAGLAIVAAADGKVSRIQRDGTFGTYGNLVMIVHTIAGKTYETVYAHLASIGVSPNQTVKAGQQIGVMGTTGGSTGVHLHFEVHRGRWNNRYSNAVDPMHYTFDPGAKALQRALVAAGIALKVDGIAGPATEAAVKAFQRAAGLVVDGSAGPATMAALERAVEKPKTVAMAQEVTKGAVYLELNKRQTDELAAVYKFARSKGIFSSAEHEAEVKAGKMTLDKAIYLNVLIAAAALNGGKRV